MLEESALLSRSGSHNNFRTYDDEVEVAGMDMRTGIVNMKMEGPSRGIFQLPGAVKLHAFLKWTCWAGIGVPFVVIFGSLICYFTAAALEIDIFRIMSPGVWSNSMQGMAIFVASTVIALVLAVVTTSMMLLLGHLFRVRECPVACLQWIMLTFLGFALLAPFYAYGAAERYSVGDADTGIVLSNLTIGALNTPLTTDEDIAAIIFPGGVQPDASRGSSAFTTNVQSREPMELCVSPIVIDKKSSAGTCFWALTLGDAKNGYRCKKPTTCPGGICQGTTAEGKIHQPFVEKAIGEALLQSPSLAPCASYTAVILRDKVDLDDLQKQAFEEGGSQLRWGLIIGAFCSVIFAVLCATCASCRRLMSMASASSSPSRCPLIFSFFNGPTGNSAGAVGDHEHTSYKTVSLHGLSNPRIGFGDGDIIDSKMGMMGL